MNQATAMGQVWQTSLRAVVAAGLCVLMVEQPLLAARPLAADSAPKKIPAAASEQMQGERKALHALNRFTFGPRPGDVEAVQAMGLEKWFERQLNPGSIRDAALEQRLEMFPAMRMTQAELMQRFPSPQVLRQMIQRDAPLPNDPTLRAVYADQIAFYKMAKARKEATDAAKPAGGVAGDSMVAGKPEGDDADSNSTMDAMAANDKAAGGGMGQGEGMAGGAKTPAKAKGKRGVDLLGDKLPNPKKPNKGVDDSMTMQAGMAALPGDGVDPTTPAMTVHEEQFYSGLEAVKILNLAPEERMKRVLGMQPAELIDFRRSLSRAELASLSQGLSPVQRETLASLQGSPKVIGAELLQTRLLRDIYSERQLEAVMTDFWLNHFNVYVRKNQNEPYLLPAYERDVIRPNALGNFESLLVATAQSPAMLMYLDNWQSVGKDSPAARNAPRVARFIQNPQVKQAMKDRGLNENYARELMELHTLGVQCEVSADRPASELPKSCGQGYTQKDVTQVAQVLTGWTIDKPYRINPGRPNQGGGGEFNFEARRHEPGSKTVLGTTIQENGEQEGLRVLHMLATSPATAEFISNKLAVRFVSDAPPPALVERMAQSFTASNGDIKTVLRTMFQSSEFWSTTAYRAKVKTPLEFVTSAARASNAEVTNALPLVQSLDRLGMPLYGMQTPNGYSWLAEPWVSTSALVSRMNFALVLSGNRLGGTRTDWIGYLGGAEAKRPMMRPVGLDKAGPNGTAAEEAAVRKERALEGLLMGQPVSERTRATVLKQFGDTTAQQQAEKEFAIQALDPELMAGMLPGGSVTSNPDRPRAIAMDAQAAVMAGLLIGSPEFQRR